MLNSGRHLLRADLEALVPVDERERQSVARILAELDRLPSPFDRDAGPIHVTASALLVGPHGVVLHLHKLAGMWLQPGGHLDRGEQPWDAAMREAREETGLDCRWTAAGQALFHADVHPAARGHTHLDLRYLLSAIGDPAPPAGESQQVRWFSPDEAFAVADPGLVGALRKLRTGTDRSGAIRWD